MEILEFDYKKPHKFQAGDLAIIKGVGIYTLQYVANGLATYKTKGKLQTTKICHLTLVHKNGNN